VIFWRSFCKGGLGEGKAALKPYCKKGLGYHTESFEIYSIGDGERFMIF
jgi:hypothetical protein